MTLDISDSCCTFRISMQRKMNEWWNSVKFYRNSNFVVKKSGYNNNRSIVILRYTRRKIWGFVGSPAGSYGPVGGSQCNDETHSALQDVKGIRERYDDFAIWWRWYVQLWIRCMRVMRNTHQEGGRIVEQARASPSSPALYIFLTGSIESLAGVAHCSFEQVRFLLTCRKKEKSQKDANERQDTFERRNK